MGGTHKHTGGDHTQTLEQSQDTQTEPIERTRRVSTYGGP